MVPYYPWLCNSGNFPGLMVNIILRFESMRTAVVLLLLAAGCGATQQLTNGRTGQFILFHCNIVLFCIFCPYTLRFYIIYDIGVLTVL